MSVTLLSLLNYWSDKRGTIKASNVKLRISYSLILSVVILPVFMDIMRSHW